MISQQSACLQTTDNRKLCSCCPHLPRRLDGENLLILSLIQLLCGSAAIILFGVALTKEGYLHQVGTGMWSGSLMLAAGCLGVATSRHRTACTLISLLVICVMTAVTSAILASVSTAGLVQDGVKRARTAKLHLIVLHTLLFIVGFLECSVAVTTAIICGRQVCFGAIYFPQNSNSRRRSCAAYSRGSMSARNQCSIFGGPQQDLHGLANLLTATNTTPSITGPLSHIIGRNSGQLPILTTNSFYTNVLFPQLDRTSTQPLSAATCRTSLVYLLPSPSQDEPSILFPPFPPCYSDQESRPLSAYACLNTAESGDALLQPVLLVEEHPPPYSSNDNLVCINRTRCSDIDTKSSFDDVVVLIEQNPSIFTSRSSPAPSSSSSSKLS